MLLRGRPTLQIRYRCYLEITRILRSGREGAFLALDDYGLAVGFIEVSTRDYAQDARSSPVGYVEGIYVSHGHRRKGIGAALIRAAEAWARERGCTQMGSDTAIGNRRSMAFHKATGFRIVERAVLFLKEIPAARGSRRRGGH